MKDKFARELIGVLRTETRRDYDIHIANAKSILQAHERLLEYLNLEIKRTPATVTHVKRGKKNG